MDMMAKGIAGEFWRWWWRGRRGGGEVTRTRTKTETASWRVERMAAGSVFKVRDRVNYAITNGWTCSQPLVARASTRAGRIAFYPAVAQQSPSRVSRAIPDDPPFCPQRSSYEPLCSVASVQSL